MHRVFNCGIGMVLIVAQADAQSCLDHLSRAGEAPRLIGTIVERAPGAAQTRVV
jgi:phosphoribosylformylglycinamidine cyclo-ligase